MRNAEQYGNCNVIKFKWVCHCSQKFRAGIYPRMNVCPNKNLSRKYMAKSVLPYSFEEESDSFSNKEANNKTKYTKAMTLIRMA